MGSGLQELEWFARESLLRGLDKQAVRLALVCCKNDGAPAHKYSAALEEP
jgi:hypothetical protein